MSLKTFIDLNVQDYLKENAGNLLAGIQISNTYKLLNIYNAVFSGSNDAISEITAVEINKEYPFSEISRTVLATDLIYFDSVTNQYLIDKTKEISLTAEKIYYLEFKNGFNIFETEAFIVKKINNKIGFDITFITFDSDIITFDTTFINK